MNHTKEPWTTSGTWIGSVDNECVAFAHENNEMSRVNAKRIVACINACAGLTNEQLDSGYIQNLINDYNKAMVMANYLNTMLENFLKEYKDESL